MTGLSRLKFSLWIVGSFAVFFAAIFLAPLFGAEKASLLDAIRELNTKAVSVPNFDIVFLQRFPRALLGAVAGGVLGLAGASFQTVLQNPLATPYTLGVASAGSLGAVIIVTLNLAISVGPFSSVQVGALAGAGLDVALVSALARRQGPAGSNLILLSGITVSLITAAMVMLVRYLASPYRMAEMDRWMMGGIDVVGYDPLASIVPFSSVGLAAILFHIRSMDQLSFGPAMAAARGVNVHSLQRDVFWGGSLAVAAVVSVTGPIGFVGLIIPHAVKKLVPRDHRVILPVSFAAAGAFLVMVDTAARVIAAPAELPVGILTAVIGGPIFLIILVQKHRAK